MVNWIKKYTIPKDEFEELKERILLAIDMIKDEYDTSFANMSHSDYKAGDANKIYRPYFIKWVKPYLQDYCQQWRCDSVDVQNVWFAEYLGEDGADFDYHTHEGSNMSGALQLLIEDKRNCTVLMHHPIDTDEGDLLLFPAMLPHKSPYVFDGRKIVIGFNWNMSGSIVHSDIK